MWLNEIIKSHVRSYLFSFDNLGKDYGDIFNHG